MNRKGLATNTLAKLILVVLVVIVVAAGFGYFFPKAWATIADMLGGLLGLGPATDLEKAILCAYYRCTDGCSSSKLNDLEFRVPGEPEPVSCTEFCNVEWTDTGNLDGKICDHNAEQFPVEILVSEDTASKKRLKSKWGDETCIVTDNSVFDSLIGTINEWFVFIKKSLIEDDSEYEKDKKCVFTPGGQGINEAFSEVVISGNGDNGKIDIYIYTHWGSPNDIHLPAVWIKGNTFTTEVDDQPTYIILKLDGDPVEEPFEEKSVGTIQYPETEMPKFRIVAGDNELVLTLNIGGGCGSEYSATIYLEKGGESIGSLTFTSDNPGPYGIALTSEEKIDFELLEISGEDYYGKEPLEPSKCVGAVGTAKFSIVYGSGTPPPISFVCCSPCKCEYHPTRWNGDYRCSSGCIDAGTDCPCEHPPLTWDSGTSCPSSRSNKLPVNYCDSTTDDNEEACQNLCEGKGYENWSYDDVAKVCTCS